MAEDEQQQQQLVEWVRQRLRSLLGFDDVDGIADQILYSIGNRRDLEAYVQDVAGEDGAAFARELAKRLFPDSIDAYEAPAAGRGKSRRRQKPPSTAPVDPNRGRGLIIKTVPSAKKPGPSKHRKRCDCFGTQHDVFTNCLSCGRILCSVEGEGECFFCGSYVHKDRTDPAARSAIERKDVILGYQKEMKARSVVIDEQDAGGNDDHPADNRAFANRSLQGRTLELYEVIHASLQRK
ncbi:TRIP4/RQT4 C2HC5-type zinc finger domain-containing protein [Plasmodiophora brassicae]|uniref:TRIP4/RQT4 C2HC5-type zinc finger domain-containing protein n=1 Tax=Plasmodiophora brassicae TaxID=37360 RepID=A0A0G4IU90_PLABS|nr:hypothetical protein PBRA_006818 [Plasmodiophora brassicae]SPR00842.1 unnamed protein product [Plasmodiophora brassicae]